MRNHSLVSDVPARMHPAQNPTVAARRVSSVNGATLAAAAALRVSAGSDASALTRHDTERRGDPHDTLSSPAQHGGSGNQASAPHVCTGARNRIRQVPRRHMTRHAMAMVFAVTSTIRQEAP
jgi:hypothetical protein